MLHIKKELLSKTAEHYEIKEKMIAQALNVKNTIISTG